MLTQHESNSDSGRMSGDARRAGQRGTAKPARKAAAARCDVTDLYGDGAMLDVCTRFYNKVRSTRITHSTRRMCAVPR